MNARLRLPDRRSHEVLAFEHGGFRFTAGIGRYPDAVLAEMLLSASAKSGTVVEAWARDSAILASLALQHGVPVDTIRRALSRDERSRATTPLGELLDLLADDKEVRS